MNSLLEELQKKCEHVHHVPGGGSSIEEAGEGAQSLMEALKHLNRLPTSVQGAMDVPVTMHLLGRAQTLLTCCVEAVIFNKMSLFPPLAQPRNDWDFASDHLPIGARLHFSKGKEHLSSFNIASWNISHKSDASSKDEVLAIKEVKELLHHSEIHILCLQDGNTPKNESMDKYRESRVQCVDGRTSGDVESRFAKFERKKEIRPRPRPRKGQDYKSATFLFHLVSSFLPVGLHLVFVIFLEQNGPMLCSSVGIAALVIPIEKTSESEFPLGQWVAIAHRDTFASQGHSCCFG